MTCHEESIRARLDDWLDGALTPARAAEVERHVADCSECRAEVEALRAILREAAALPPALEPSRDLWPEIASRIAAAGDPDAESVPAVAPAPAQRRARPIHPAWTWSGWLAAAACFAFALMARAPSDGRSLASSGPGADVAPLESAMVAMLRDWEAGSAQAQDEYAAALEQSGAMSATETAAGIGRGLETIDVALAETRAALAADPGNSRLVRLLATGYAERIELLRRATRLATQQRA